MRVHDITGNMKRHDKPTTCNAKQQKRPKVNFSKVFRIPKKIRYSVITPEETDCETGHQHPEEHQQEVLFDVDQQQLNRKEVHHPLNGLVVPYPIEETH